MLLISDSCRMFWRNSELALIPLGDVCVHMKLHSLSKPVATSTLSPAGLPRSKVSTSMHRISCYILLNKMCNKIWGIQTNSFIISLVSFLKIKKLVSEDLSSSLQAFWAGNCYQSWISLSDKSRSVLCLQNGSGQQFSPSNCVFLKKLLDNKTSRRCWILWWPHHWSSSVGPLCSSLAY